MRKPSIKENEPIALRAKALKGGRQSLYLDYYVEGSKNHNHKYEFLKLYLLPETSKENRELNKVTLQSAKAIQAQRLIERANGKANIRSKADSRINIIDYMRHFADLKAQYGQSKQRESTILKVIKHIEIYNPNVTLSQIDKAYCLGFVRYLSTAKSFKEKENPNILSRYTTHNYYNALVAVLNNAVREELIETNPASKVSAEEKKMITPTSNERTYLSLEELQSLIGTKCGNENVKRAFLFACYTGLRYSDIVTLQWEDIKKEGDRMSVQKTMIKTRQLITVPIGKAAASYLPPRKKGGKVFSLPLISSVSNSLKAWAKKAEIKKNVSFHISRHTFATSLLTKGADLYTVSKLLGHTDIAVTQVYAEIVNQKRVEAIKLLDE